VRLFVAVDVPDGIKAAIEKDVVDVLRPALPAARWTRPEGRHLTLKFLGEVPDEEVAQVSAALETAASKHEPFEAAFGPVGSFPNLKRPRVLWAGLSEGDDAMTALARDVEQVLVPLGFEPEGRDFHAHFTLARFKTPSAIGELPPVDVPGDRFTVSEVTLFRSQLHPKGARYSVVSSSTLSA
jgi:RNA 2',3'-cyclic 3'-phosphodiesterase